MLVRKLDEWKENNSGRDFSEYAKIDFTKCTLPGFAIQCHIIDFMGQTVSMATVYEREILRKIMSIDSFKESMCYGLMPIVPEAEPIEEEQLPIPENASLGIHDNALETLNRLQITWDNYLYSIDVGDFFVVVFGSTAEDLFGYEIVTMGKAVAPRLLQLVEQVGSTAPEVASGLALRTVVGLGVGLLTIENELADATLTPEDYETLVEDAEQAAELSTEIAEEEKDKDDPPGPCDCRKRGDNGESNSPTFLQLGPVAGLKASVIKARLESQGWVKIADYPADGGLRNLKYSKLGLDGCGQDQLHIFRFGEGDSDSPIPHAHKEKGKLHIELSKNKGKLSFTDSASCRTNYKLPEVHIKPIIWDLGE